MGDAFFFRPPDYTKGVFQTLGLKEFHKYLMMSEEEKITEEGQKLLAVSIEDMKLYTRRYARRQNKMILGRFLEHPNREIPQIYELHTTDISKWDENVKEKAILIIESYINETTCPLQAMTSNMPDKKREINAHSSNFCEVCERLLIGDKQYELHLTSNKHKRVLKKKKQLEKSNESLNSQNGN